MATFYLDFENGNDASAGTSWATAWKTLNNGATAARIAPGDEIRIAKTADPTSIGNATWTNKSATVTLASAQTTNIYLDGAWTAANTATATTSTTRKEGANATQITTPATTNTTTKYAYYATGTLDLSSSDAITLWFRNNTTTIADNTRWVIKLCSDTLGDTAVDEFAIPASISTGRWMPITLTRNGGGNLGNSIQSIALYTGAASPGNSQVVLIDNVLACSSTGLHLRSLISKNSVASGGTETWHGLQSINGTTVILGNENSLSAGSANLRGYYTSGTSPSTVTTYIRQTAIVIGTNNTTLQPLQDSGTAGNLITYSGGWNTSNNTQDGETWVDGFDGAGCTFTSFNNRDYIKWERVNTVRYSLFNSINGSISSGCNVSVICANMGGGIAFNDCFVRSTLTITINNSVSTYLSYGASPDNEGNYINLYQYNNTASTGQYNTRSVYFDNFVIANNSSINMNFRLKATRQFNNLTIDHCTSPVLNFQSDILNNMISTAFYIKSLTITNNTSPQLNIAAAVINKLTMSGNGTLSGTWGDFYVKQTNALSTAIMTSNNNYYSSQPATFYSAVNNVITDNRMYWNYGNALSQTTTRKSASGVAWQINITNTFQSSLMPANMPIAKIACNANALVTVKAWVKLSHATDIGAKLMIQANEIAGVSADVTATKSADTNWEELTITFTPTVAGVAQIYIQAYWLANLADESVFVDDITVTQA